jgi:hypothetical protein
VSHREQEAEFVRLQPIHHWERNEGKWTKDGATAINTDELKREILKEHHDHSITGHPGAASTYFSVRRRYW